MECKRPYAREMRRFVCAFRLRTYGVRSVNPALLATFLEIAIMRLCIGSIRAFISSSYIREESPILTLSWWGWRSCYESVVLGAPFTPAGSTARSALNLVRHYIVTSHAAGLNIA